MGRSTDRSQWRLRHPYLLSFYDTTTSQAVVGAVESTSAALIAAS